MDNEESSKLRDKQCYFRKRTDGYRRANPEIKNNIDSQRRGPKMWYNWRTRFSYFTTYTFMTSSRYYKSTMEKILITFPFMSVTYRAVLSIFSPLSIHKYSYTTIQKISPLCKTPYTFSMMPEITGRLKIRVQNVAYLF